MQIKNLVLGLTSTLIFSQTGFANTSTEVSESGVIRSIFSEDKLKHWTQESTYTGYFDNSCSKRAIVRLDFSFDQIKNLASLKEMISKKGHKFATSALDDSYPMETIFLQPGVTRFVPLDSEGAKIKWENDDEVADEELEQVLVVDLKKLKTFFAAKKSDKNYKIQIDELEKLFQPDSVISQKRFTKVTSVNASIKESIVPQGILQKNAEIEEAYEKAYPRNSSVEGPTYSEFSNNKYYDTSYLRPEVYFTPAGIDVETISGLQLKQLILSELKKILSYSNEALHTHMGDATLFSIADAMTSDRGDQDDSTSLNQLVNFLPDCSKK